MYHICNANAGREAACRDDTCPVTGDARGKCSLCSYDFGIGHFSLLSEVLPQLLFIDVLGKAFDAEPRGHEGLLGFFSSHLKQLWVLSAR